MKTPEQKAKQAEYQRRWYAKQKPLGFKKRDRTDYMREYKRKWRAKQKEGRQ